jgi:hypothetical protein
LIAIVGGSGSVLKHTHGKLIDKHDMVIRFNENPIEGYEQYVGSKTNMRFIAYHGADYDLQCESIFLYSYNKKALQEAYKKLTYQNANIVYPLSKEFINNCDNLISKPYWKWRLMPGQMIVHKRMSSSGLKAILYAFDMWGARINLFGFKEDEQFHYWEPNRTHYNQDLSHDFGKEREIIKGFEREGKLKILS